LYAKLTAKRDSLFINETSQIDTFPNLPTTNANPFSSQSTYQTTVNPPTYNAEYYQFSIDSFGWYNVDALIKESANCVNSELQVTINGEATEQVHIYLVIPDKKVFIEGELLKDKKAFGFYEDNGKIPLPQGFPAFVIAHTEKSGKLYFGQTSFLISLKQNLQLALKENTKEGILKAMESLKLDDMKMQIDSANPVVKSMKVLEEEAKAALELSELAMKEKKVDEINEVLYKIQFKLSGCDCLSKQSGRLPKI
jgi:hypothetical protein